MGSETCGLGSGRVACYMARWALMAGSVSVSVIHHLHHSPAVYWGCALAWSHQWTIFIVPVMLMLPAHATLILIAAWLPRLHV